MASEITVQTIRGPASGVNANKILIPAGQTLDASSGFIPPAGGVLQVVQTVMDTTVSSSAASWTNIGALQVSITPSSNANKILVLVNFSVGCDSATADVMMRLTRNGTPIALGQNGGTNQITRIPVSGALDAYKSQDNAVTFLDSPSSSSSVVYQVQMRNWSSTTHGWFIGRRALNNSFMIPSFITVMEIAG